MVLESIGKQNRNKNEEFKVSRKQAAKATAMRPR